MYIVLHVHVTNILPFFCSNVENNQQLYYRVPRIANQLTNLIFSTHFLCLSKQEEFITLFRLKVHIEKKNI